MNIINPTENIIFVSLANTMLFETYEVFDGDSLKEAYVEFNKVLDKHGYHDTDIELQVAESETGLNDYVVDYLADLYQIQEDNRHNYPEDIRVLIELFKYYRNLQDVESALQNRCYYIYHGRGVNPKIDAFDEYLRDVGGIFDRVPEDLHSYIDVESIYIDYKSDGMVTLELDDNEYMFLFNH